MYMHSEEKELCITVQNPGKKKQKYVQRLKIVKRSWCLLDLKNQVIKLLHIQQNTGLLSTDITYTRQ